MSLENPNIRSHDLGSSVKGTLMSVLSPKGPVSQVDRLEGTSDGNNRYEDMSGRTQLRTVSSPVSNVLAHTGQLSLTLWDSWRSRSGSPYQRRLSSRLDEPPKMSSYSSCSRSSTSHDAYSSSRNSMGVSGALQDRSESDLRGGT